jgi:hypothetical protein
MMNLYIHKISQNIGKGTKLIMYISLVGFWYHIEYTNRLHWGIPCAWYNITSKNKIDKNFNSCMYWMTIHTYHMGINHGIWYYVDTSKIQLPI